VLYITTKASLFKLSVTTQRIRTKILAEWNRENILGLKWQVVTSG
jgi:hypothetical protein